MSVEDPLDVRVDLDDDGSARAVVTERRELEIDDLFVDGEFRLWEDEVGWSGYTREEIDEDVVIYHHQNTRFDEDRWIKNVIGGEQAVRGAIRQHIRDPVRTVLFVEHSALSERVRANRSGHGYDGGYPQIYGSSLPNVAHGSPAYHGARPLVAHGLLVGGVRRLLPLIGVDRAFATGTESVAGDGDRPP